MKMFCFTIAGGNTSFFEQIEKKLEPNISVIKLEYSGHGTRHKEPFYKDFGELAEDMYQQICLQLLEKPNEEYVLFGYSMGSISAIEVLRKIITNKEMPMPVHIFLAAHEPRTMIGIEDFAEEQLDEFVKNRTIKFGGLPETLIYNKSFWRMYLPIYRADYSIIGKYDFENLDFRTRIPASVFYSEKDTPYSSMKEWKKYFVDECEFICYEGNHFFIKEHYQEMAQFINEKIEKIMDENKTK